MTGKRAGVVAAKTKRYVCSKLGHVWPDDRRLRPGQDRHCTRCGERLP